MTRSITVVSGASAAGGKTLSSVDYRLLAADGVTVLSTNPPPYSGVTDAAVYLEQTVHQSDGQINSVTQIIPGHIIDLAATDDASPVLTWTDVEGEASYEIHRVVPGAMPDIVGHSTRINSPVANTPTFTDNNVIGNGVTQVAYRVVALTPFGYTLSNEAVCTPAAHTGTFFSNAIRIDAVTDQAVAAANAAYDDLNAFTYAILARFDNTGSGWIMGKQASSDTLGWRINTTADLSVDYATTDGFKRAAGLATDNSWTWLFVACDRVAHTTTRAAGPAGGTIADIHRGVTDGGSGAFVSDAAQSFKLGFNGSAAAARNMEVRFVGVAGSVLSLANMQAIAADAVGQAALFIDYWKPGAGDTTQCPSAKNVLPPLIYSGASLV